MGRRAVGSSEIKISLHNNLFEIEDDWHWLQENGLCTLYQTFEWCKAWQDSAGSARRIEPAIVRGCTPEGKPLFILPFAISKTIGIRALIWYMAPEITYGMGVIDHQYLRQHPGFLERLWPDIMTLFGTIDFIRLGKQPENWDGIENPLRFLFTTRSANQSYRMALQPGYQALYLKKQSSSARSGARRRDRLLQATGKLEFGLPEAGTETYDVINTMINHQQDRLGQRGIRSVFDETRRAFLQQLAKATWQDGTRVLLPYHLKIDGKISAVMLGGAFASTYWALISSLTPDKTLHTMSPGNHALRATVEAICERGFDTLDFASGDTDYKAKWSDEKVRLFESNISVTLTGRVATTAIIAATTAKRVIKRTPWLFSIVQSVRKAILKKKS